MYMFMLQVLMRALRDFNTPKIVTDDVPIFMGLIGDLFPALDVPRKRDLDFEACVKEGVLVSSKGLDCEVHVHCTCMCTCIAHVMNMYDCFLDMLHVF